MKLSIKQVTWLLDNNVIKAQDFDTVCFRQSHLPSHLMMLQKAGLITADEIKIYESNIDWSVDNLLNESSNDKELMGKYDYKFQNYLREQLADYKLNGHTYLTIFWDNIEYNIPELVKLLYVKRLARFGYNYVEKKHNDSGKEFYRFTIGLLDSKL